MNRILSPLNVASFLFTVLTFWIVINWNKSEKRKEKISYEKEYIAHLSQHEETIMAQAVNSLPVRLPARDLTFNRMERQDSCIVFHCSYSKPDTRFWSMGDSEFSRALIDRLHKGFHYNLADLILIKGYSVRVVTTYKGRQVEDVTISPQEIMYAYTRGFYGKDGSGSLKSWAEHRC